MGKITRIAVSSIAALAFLGSTASAKPYVQPNGHRLTGVATFTLINAPTTLPVAQIENAIENQVLVQFSPRWHTGQVRFGARGIPVRFESPNAVHKACGGEADAGCHTAWGAGHLVIYIQNVGTLSVMLDHEILETLGDPEMDVYGPSPHRSLEEACDPVEANTYLYDGVDLQDFVYPNYFKTHKVNASTAFTVAAVTSPAVAGQQATQGAAAPKVPAPPRSVPAQTATPTTLPLGPPGVQLPLGPPGVSLPLGPPAGPPTDTPTTT